MISKMKQLTMIGFLSLLLAACSGADNDNDDLQNDNPAVGGDDETEEPGEEKDSGEELEDDTVDDEGED